MKRSYYKWIILLCIIAIPSYGLWVLKGLIFNEKGDFPALSVISEEPIPSFTFINQDKDTITNDYYKGKIYIANFMFTTCPTICPIMTWKMEYLQGKLSKYDNVYFLSHTINPEYDTPEVLKKYALKAEKQYGANLESWNFVTGDKDSIYNIAKSYLSVVAESNEEGSHAGRIHSQDFILIDDKGRIRSGYDSSNNPVGSYDSSRDSNIKDLIIDVGVLVSEIKRNNR